MASKTLNVVNLIEDDSDDDLCVLYSKPAVRNMGRTASRLISVESYSGVKDRSFTGRKPKEVIDLSPDNFKRDNHPRHFDDVQVIGSIPGAKKRILKGESSDPKPQESVDVKFLCDICADEKPQIELFRIKGCTHSYCSECMAKYIDSKLQENQAIVTCPVVGCGGKLEPQSCRSILPPQVFDRWGIVLCESLIKASEKFYCPFKDCSALLINDGMWNGGVDITNSEFPYCFRMFCAKCRVPWHSEISCVEFQKLNKDEREREDIMLMNLAKGKHWKRCPKCRFFVEKSDGCMFMFCRCGCHFCYRCGSLTPRDHQCSKCMS